MTGTSAPHRRFTGDTLILATHNPAKVSEFQSFFKDAPFALATAGSRGVPEPEETETSFAGNSRLKALHSARHTGLVSLADDSGLVVPALAGQPGVLSARWAGENRDFRIAMTRLERELEGIADRRAYFIVVLCLAWPDGHTQTYTGKWHGRLSFPPRGDKGFGYCPVFVPEGSDITAGEMEPCERHALSHRSKAFALLREDLRLHENSGGKDHA